MHLFSLSQLCICLFSLNYATIYSLSIMHLFIVSQLCTYLFSLNYTPIYSLSIMHLFILSRLCTYLFSPNYAPIYSPSIMDVFILFQLCTYITNGYASTNPINIATGHQSHLVYHKVGYLACSYFLDLETKYVHK